MYYESNKSIIEKKKETARKELEKFSLSIREYREEHGNKYTEYLVYRLQMEEYFRGVWNTLNELERELNL